MSDPTTAEVETTEEEQATGEVATARGDDKSPSASDREWEQLELLFDYTKFHIGLYAVLIASLTALLSLGSESLPPHFHFPLKVTVVLFVFAGMCGGVVASNSFHFAALTDFKEKEIGFWNACRPMSGQAWIIWEHAFFWLGIVNAVLAFLLAESYPLALEPEETTPSFHRGSNRWWW